MISLRFVLIAFMTLFHMSFGALFHLRASLPGNALDGQVLNAASGSFFLGLAEPASYCPDQVQPNCPNSTEAGTVFAGLTALWVEVPGGQQVYVAPNGALGFTQAHSASTPPGSYIGGFTNVTIVSPCAPPLQVFNWEAPDKSTEGILACPYNSTTTAASQPLLQIYAKTPAFNQTGCTELTGLWPHYIPDDSPFGAWQYT